jgi:bifunctional non-homologous end joining protein LigD
LGFGGRDGDLLSKSLLAGIAEQYRQLRRYPAVAATAAQLRANSFTIDGEAVVCGPDRVAIFDALHRRGAVSEAMLYAFDLLELDGEDLRALPLGDRKKRLARLLGKRRIGISQPAHRRGRHDGVRACLQVPLRGHRVEAALRAPPIGPVAGLD